MTCNFILVDGSYFCFYRYYSMLKRWKYMNNGEELEDPILNERFVELFKQNFIECLRNLPKHLNLTNTNYKIIIGKDCKRANIWRNLLYPDYKGTRNNINFKGGPFFKMVYDENLFKLGGASYILYHHQLEADDCIGISCKYLLNKSQNNNIYIITSDKDYLQLIETRVKIFNLEYKEINNLKNNINESSIPSAKCDLFCKIVMGDKSDNITSIFPKCGPKTALKYFNDPNLFQTTLLKYNAYEKYNLNKTLVDFNEIPLHLVTEFINNNNKFLNFDYNINIIFINIIQKLISLLFIGRSFIQIKKLINF